jgi:hypothetical protein
MEPVLFICGAIAMAAIGWPAWNRWRTHSVMAALTPVAARFNFELGHAPGSTKPNAMRGTLNGVVVVVECPMIPIFERSDGRIDHRQGKWTLDLRTTPQLPLSVSIRPKGVVDWSLVSHADVYTTGDDLFDRDVVCVGDAPDILPLLHPSLKTTIEKLVNCGAAIDHGNIVMPLTGALRRDSAALGDTILDVVGLANVFAEHMRRPKDEILIEVAREHPNPRIRNAAASQFVRAFPRHPRRTELIEACLVDSDPSVIIWAATNAQADSIDMLIEQANNRQLFPYVRAAALTAAGMLAPGHPSLPDATKQCRLVDERPMVIATTKVAVAAQMRELSAWLMNDLNDHNPETRQAAASLLASSDLPAVHELRHRALKIDDTHVVEKATQGIMKFGTINDVPRLLAAIESGMLSYPNEAACRTAIQALQSRVGGDQVGAFSLLDATSDRAGSIAIVDQPPRASPN